MRLNSFDEVVAFYNNTHPIRGARLAQDLRPLGERRRWWERIAKVNENKYLLMDGNWTWRSPTMENWEKTCPMIWERREDGDYLTIRNHPEGSFGISRYDFLRVYIPIGMAFEQGNGVHYIKYGSTSHYLAKFKGQYDSNGGGWDITEDYKLVFKHEDGVFTRANELQPKKTRRIDKEIDKHYSQKLREMWDWMTIVLPIMGEHLNRDKAEYLKTLTDTTYSWNWHNRMPIGEMRKILDDAEHPKRVALAVCLAISAEAMEGGRFTPKPDSFKKARDVIRKGANLYKVEMC